jgi:hypothetical protein
VPQIGYTAVLVIVILELVCHPPSLPPPHLALPQVFAFGVGVGCVLFSLNLVRSVYSSNENQPDISPSHFPKSKPSEHRPTLEEPLLAYNTFEESAADESLLRPTGPSEAEENRSIFAILKTFTDYIRIFWALSPSSLPWEGSLLLSVS